MKGGLSLYQCPVNPLCSKKLYTQQFILDIWVKDSLPSLNDPSLLLLLQVLPFVVLSRLRYTLYVMGRKRSTLINPNEWKKKTYLLFLIEGAESSRFLHLES